MDGQQFDRLARTLVARRAVMRTLFGGAIGAGVGWVENVDAANRPKRRKGKRRQPGRRNQGNQNARTPECGGAGQPCCQNGACAAGRICQGGICADAPPASACGGASQPCCHGGACAGDLVCRNNATCEPCGGQNEPCCGSHCAGALECSAEPEGDICRACGYSGTPCCAGGTCRRGNCIPFPEGGPQSDTRCEVTCGGIGQPCCHGAAQRCASETVCLAGTCTPCGNPGDPCCAGNACNNCRICNSSGICIDEFHLDC